MRDKIKAVIDEMSEKAGLSEEFSDSFFSSIIDDEEVLGHMLSTICEKNGVSVDTLTEDEQNFLSNEINRRWG